MFRAMSSGGVKSSTGPGLGAAGPVRVKGNSSESVLLTCDGGPVVKLQSGSSSNVVVRTGRDGTIEFDVYYA